LNSLLKCLRDVSLITCSFLKQATILIHCLEIGVHYNQKGCFQLQEIKGVVYKVDTCSGKVEELKPPVAPGNSATSPATQSNK
jgi:hypothetical protein